MSKKIILSALMLGLVTACQPPTASKELDEKIAKLEKRIADLEKRPAGPQAPQPPPPQTAAYVIPTGDSPIMGNKDAKITIQVFSDYQCPFCAKADPVLRDILKDPELKEKANLVFKQFPLGFHQNAKPAAKAALAARDLGGDAKFWEMSDKLFANFKDLSDANYPKWAKEIGLNEGKFTEALKSNDSKYEAIIKADMDLGQNAAKVRGTPSIFVNGWELRNRSADGVKQLAKEKNLGL